MNDKLEKIKKELPDLDLTGSQENAVLDICRIILGEEVELKKEEVLYATGDFIKYKYDFESRYRLGIIKLENIDQDNYISLTPISGLKFSNGPKSVKVKQRDEIPESKIKELLGMNQTKWSGNVEVFERVKKEDILQEKFKDSSIFSIN